MSTPQGWDEDEILFRIISTLRALTKREFLFVGEFMPVIMII